MASRSGQRTSMSSSIRTVRFLAAQQRHGGGEGSGRREPLLTGTAAARSSGGRTNDSAISALVFLLGCGELGGPLAPEDPSLGRRGQRRTGALDVFLCPPPLIPRLSPAPLVTMWGQGNQQHGGGYGGSPYQGGGTGHGQGGQGGGYQQARRRQIGWIAFQILSDLSISPNGTPAPSSCSKPWPAPPVDDAPFLPLFAARRRSRRRKRPGMGPGAASGGRRRSGSLRRWRGRGSPPRSRRWRWLRLFLQCGCRSRQGFSVF